MTWVTFSSNKKQIDGEFFLFVAANIAKTQGAKIGLISSIDDKVLLENSGIYYCDHIEGSVSGRNGAQTKLTAILNYLPNGDALCDMDVIWTRPMQPYDQSEAWALNPEPFHFYKDYTGQEHLVKLCLPKGNITANAGFLYAPQQLFREYAQRALELSEKIDCIGATYEQMFFVKFCQENGLQLNFVYPEKIHSYEAIEKCYQATGIRHPFSFKASLQELQRFITIGMQFGDPDAIEWWVKRKMPMFKSMIRNEVFDYPNFSA